MKNKLNAEKYLFSPQLYNALLNGKFENRDNNYIVKHGTDSGVYLVFIKILNKNDKSLVYNYIYYDK